MHLTPALRGVLGLNYGWSGPEGASGKEVGGGQGGWWLGHGPWILVLVGSGLWAEEAQLGQGPWLLHWGLQGGSAGAPSL